MITSTANPQVKNLQQLMKKSSVRSAQDIFLVEGMKMYLEAPRERIHKIYVSKSLYEEKGQAFFDGVPMEVLDDRVYAAVSDTTLVTARSNSDFMAFTALLPVSPIWVASA